MTMLRTMENIDKNLQYNGAKLGGKSYLSSEHCGLFVS